MRRIIFLLFLFSASAVFAQTKWYNPETEKALVHGQIVPAEKRSNYYYRFPDAYRKNVRDVIWSLSKNNAGESIRFYTNSKKITVRYSVEDSHAYNHMPATGKSGVDMYAYDENGKQKWCAANYSFGDTVVYNYEKLYYDKPIHSLGYEYTLYLPPYNSVKWLEIGVDDASAFKFIPATLEKPIIAYGTSITQGACASRPGMIWTNIVARELSSPLINLGFSGSAHIEKEVIDIIKSVPAKLIIFDCMPNMMDFPDQIKPRLVEAVKAIRKVQPETPIIFTDHLGYPHSRMVEGWGDKVTKSIAAQRDAYQTLLAAGVRKLEYLSYDDIAMPEDATVEGVHPSDYGMRVYADAYTKKIRQILAMPEGEYSTQKPVTQRREPQVYEWREHHEAVMAQAIKSSTVNLVVLGNSIMQQWGGTGAYFPIKRDSAGWAQKVAPLGAVNMGAGWDRVENILWRIYHGALDGYTAKKVVLTIGVNNLGINNDTEIAEGIRTVIQAIKQRQPAAEIKVNGIFPARSQENRIKDINELISKVAAEEKVRYDNPGELLLMTNGKVDPALCLNDGLHLNANGYKRIVDRFVK